MKRYFWLILAVLPFLFSCHKPPKGPTEPMAAGPKQITIAVSESGGGFVIDEPAPSASRVSKGKVILFRFINNCSGNVTLESATLSAFEDEETDPEKKKKLFEDLSTQLSCPLSLDSGKESGSCKTSRVSTDALGHSYTYKIDVVIKSKDAEATASKDPRIIVAD